MAGYVFLGNSTKPTEKEAKSRDVIKLDNVSRPCLQAAINLGYEVYLGVNREKAFELRCDELPVKLYDSHTYRSITAFQDNWIAYRNLCEIIKKHDVKVIHCNSPVGGMIGRLAGRKCRVKKVIYTAHGFHFYKGAPFINRTLYKWAEQLMAHWTDVIITINKEDYEAAKKFRMKKGGKVYLVHGVGIDTSQYSSIGDQRAKKRGELQLRNDDVAVISMGDLIERKNYSMAIQAIAKARNKNLQYFICGDGPEKNSLQALAESFNISDQIHFLGYRPDIKELLAASDIFLFTTKQEGLARSMMEAMASGLPCVVSRIRGNTDLIENTNGGFLCDAADVSDYAEKLNMLAADPGLRKEMGESNLLTILKFSTGAVADEIYRLYNAELARGGVIFNAYIKTLTENIPLRAKKRMESGIPLNAFVLVSAGDLNKNKNNQIVISAIERLNKENVYYVLCGTGEKEKELKKQVQNAGLQEQVRFLGYQNDIKEIYETADCFIMTSFREGLPRSTMEAMAMGLPCIVSRIRGNADLIDDGRGGFLCGSDAVEEYVNAIRRLYCDRELCRRMGEYNRRKIKKFDIENVKKEISEIYRTV